MHTTSKSSLPRPGFGRQVPDETLDRDTKVPLSDNGEAPKESQVETDAPRWNLLREKKNTA